ncbi:MAG: D-alanyl-D-alanine carboxypeptidase [Pseudomonadota bacterium]
MSSVTLRAVFLALAFFLLSAAAPAAANSKYAAYVVHADSGDILFDRYSTARRYPASLTKMMTLYFLFEALENGDLTLQSKLKVSPRAAGQPPSKLGVKSGSTITVETAIQALVIKSANDVAVVVAEHFSGSEWKFAKTMTAKARFMGMRNTTFRNASGLPNSRQVTTARDMAILGRRVMHDFPQYFDYFSAKSFTYKGRTYSTHNALVRNYDGADGIKTGYTRRSGFNLVTSVERDGVKLIGVVLGGRKSWSRDRHMREILDNAFASIKKNPAKIAALHRIKPSPRLKPTLLAAMAAEDAAPTIGNNEALRQEILTMAEGMGAQPHMDNDGADLLGALIASAEDTDDYNEFERAVIASVATPEGFIGEGDLQSVDEFVWSVQIGAYADKSLAQSELEAAAVKGDLTERSRAVLPTPRADGSILYRARFRKLSEIEATLACSELKSAGVSCFVVTDADS